jgi:hypothetical protein
MSDDLGAPGSATHAIPEFFFSEEGSGMEGISLMCVRKVRGGSARDRSMAGYGV